MKKKIIIYIISVIVILISFFCLYKLYQYIRIKTAKIEIVLTFSKSSTIDRID